MKLRPPAYPLITVDPYFSVWSSSDRLTDSTAMHWTGSDNTVNGFCEIDGVKYRFMGDSDSAPAMEQLSVDTSMLTTDYVFSAGGVRLSVSFFTPLLPGRGLYELSRPVSFLAAKYSSEDGKARRVKITLEVSEEICVNKKGETPVTTEIIGLPGGLKAAKTGSAEQKILWRDGDDLRIDWGYFYLTGPVGAAYRFVKKDGMKFACVSFAVHKKGCAFVSFAYDDLKSIKYQGEDLDAYWKTKGRTVEELISDMYFSADELFRDCRVSSEIYYQKALEAGGEKYADLVCLAYRQVIAAHKLAVKKNGEPVFISKECFSNGCAATVDVTYPSSPMLLYLDTALLKATMVPVFDFAATKAWKYDFAPHDAGRYPVLDSQRYGRLDDMTYRFESQMPVEECGNMLIMAANISLIDGSTEFADRYEKHLSQWVKYLIKYGEDPENQLCTDDFAGHLKHNCNLSLKAIMGIMGRSLMLKMRGENKEAEKLAGTAKKMAESWLRRASNGDGSFRLAFDREDTFSMKYNMIWDKLWGTGLFPEWVMYSEFCSNKKHINAYGMPLDNRAAYTKSDWLMWTACLTNIREEFEEFITPMWNAFNVTQSRCPMTDWYDTDTANCVGFRHRSVQGGLFIRLLEEKMKGIVK